MPAIDVFWLNHSMGFLPDRRASLDRSGVSWPQPRMCKFARLQIERFYNVGRQRIEGSCPLVWGHCLQDKLLGFRGVRFRNNIGNMHRLAAKSRRGHPNNLSRDWLQFGHARQYARWPSPKLVPW